MITVDCVHVDPGEDHSVPVVTRYQTWDTDQIDAQIAVLELVLGHGREPVAIL